MPCLPPLFRRRRSISPALTALGLLVALMAPTAAVAAAEHAVPAVPAAATASLERIIVEWEPGVTSADRRSARDDADTELVRTLGKPAFQLVQPQPGQSVADAFAELRGDPAVRVAVRDTLSVLHATPSDPLLGQLWGLRNLGFGINGFPGAVAGDDIDAIAAWDRTVGTPSTVIADLDSGYRFDHPDLAPVAWTNPADPQDGVDNDANGIVDDSNGADFVGAQADFPTSDGNPTDDNLIDGGHGVHTAGTIGAAGNDGVGITGVARNARIMPLRVCAYSTANQETRCPASSQIAAINYAGAHGARVANMSLGGTTFNAAVRDAFASNPRTMFVISAGNDAQDNDPGGTPHYPCAYDPTTSGIPGAVDNIVCVAATDQADGLASFSDWGRTSVDLGAPGTDVLSTYPDVTYVEDTFAVDNFAAAWGATGSSGGFARTNESPLTSFGISDSPGAAPVAFSVRESTSAAVTLPAGYTRCRIRQSRQLSLGGGTYTYSVLLNGSAIAASSPSSSGGFFLDISGGALSAGGSLQLRFRYAAGSSPTGANGVWLDNISLSCIQPVGLSSAYGFLDGTSMAAPHVTGAAGLLFSLRPSATVTEVKNALLDSVDPTPSLSGRTVTGGRLNAAAALASLVPPGSETVLPETAITSAPPSQTTDGVATFVFRRIDADGGSHECRLDGAPSWSPCAGSASFSVGPGAHAFDVRARDPFGRVDPSPATATWSVVVPPPVVPPAVLPAPPAPPIVRTAQACVVPRLKGKTLRQAKAALRRAHCVLGRVTKPRARRGRSLPPLVVRSSRPGAGAVRAGGAKVALTLKVKPSRRARR